jgi:hypothetical protein
MLLAYTLTKEGAEAEAVAEAERAAMGGVTRNESLARVRTWRRHSPRRAAPFSSPPSNNLAMAHLFSGGEGGARRAAAAGGGVGGGGRGWGEDWDGEAEERAPVGARSPLPW